MVTARKREESLMQVPLAISAFTASDIESRGITNLTDLSGTTPGLFAVNQTGGGSGRNDRSSKTIVVRGFSIAPGLIFLDGAPVGNPPVSGSATPEVGDVERIEVLKGPQSAYFGRATFAGAINFVTKDPSLTGFKGRLKAEYSSYNSHDLSLSLEAPLVADKLAIRVTGHDMRKGGQYTNAADTSMKLGEQKTHSVSGQILFQPSDAFKAKAHITYMQDDDGPPAQIAIKQPADMNCNLGGTRGPWYCGTIPEYNFFPQSYISGQWNLDARARSILIDNIKGFPTAFDPHFLEHGGLKRNSFHSDLILQYKTENGWSFNSLSAYHKEKGAQISNLSFRDGQNVPNPNFGRPGVDTRPYILWLVMVQSKNFDWSQELRVTSPQDWRLRFTAGANLLRNKNPGGAGVYGETPLGTLVLSSTTRQQALTPAFFGGAYYDVLPKLTLSGEIRYQWDKVEQQALTTSTGALIPGGGPQFKTTFRSFSPRVTVDYKYADNSTAYALWSRGYRPGGFNVALAVQPPSVLAQFTALGVDIPYKEERLDNFEIGLKSTWLDGRARTRLALYKELWRQGQVPVNIIFTLPTGGVNQIQAVANVGAVNMQGAELEGEFQVTKQFQLSGTFGYADSDIKVFTCGDCLTIKGTNNGVGNRLPQAPKFQWSVSGQYEDHLAGPWNWYARVDYTHRGSFFVEYANVASVGSKDNVNLHLGVRQDNLGIEVFGRNLTRDKAAVAATLGPEALFTFATGQEIRYGLPDKRTFGIRANYSF